MKSIKNILAAFTLGVVLGGGQSARSAISVANFSTSGGGLYAGSGSGSQIIPDYPGAGAAYSINFADTGLSLANISVTLNLSGGYNGDIYAYLSHGSQIAYLLNANPAVSGSGFNITLVEGAGNPIPTGGSGILGGTGSPVQYTAYTDLATFNNTDPNGNWTLFFADMSSGDNSTLNGFSLAITAVPEPVNVALGIFAAGMLVLGFGRHRRTRSVAKLH